MVKIPSLHARMWRFGIDAEHRCVLRDMSYSAFLILLLFLAEANTYLKKKKKTKQTATGQLPPKQQPPRVRTIEAKMDKRKAEL